MNLIFTFPNIFVGDVAGKYILIDLDSTGTWDPMSLKC